MKEYRTKNKDIILDFLKMNGSHSYSAYEVHSYLEENDNNINLTTVYRNLDRLSEQGTLMKVKTAEGECCRYQYTGIGGKCNEHIHMQCRECKKLYHLECHFMEEIAGHLLEHHGFVLEGSGSMLSGLCENCRK